MLNRDGKFNGFFISRDAHIHIRGDGTISLSPPPEPFSSFQNRSPVAKGRRDVNSDSEQRITETQTELFARCRLVLTGGFREETENIIVTDVNQYFSAQTEP